MSLRLSLRRALLLGLASSLALVGCSSNQSSGTDTQAAGSGVGGTMAGTPTNGGGGAANSGGSGVVSPQAGTNAGGSTSASGGGQSATGGVSAQAGSAGHSSSSSGASGSGGRSATGGANSGGAPGSAGSAGGGGSVRTWLYDVQDTKDSAGECNLGKDAQGNPTVQARWTAMLNGMKSGDYLFIQFGINDGDSACPRHVGANAFKTSYGMLAQAAKDHGAQPVFITPVSQIACSGSTVSKCTREPYVTATKEAGTQFGVPVIDLNLLSTTLYQSLGFCPIPGGSDVSASTTGAVGTFFCDDHTHFDTSGAVQIAGLVAQAVRDQKLGLAAYLK